MARFNLDDYIPVQERVNQFWEDYPDGAIITTITHLSDDMKSVIVRSEVFKQRPENAYAVPDVTGIAEEHAGNHAMVNSTSWIEACETSAIGRALANMGYATSNKDRPSREEMEKVSRSNVPLIDDKGRRALEAIRTQKGLTHDQMSAIAKQRYPNLASTTHLTVEQGRDFWAYLDALPDTKENA